MRFSGTLGLLAAMTWIAFASSAIAARPPVKIGFDKIAFRFTGGYEITTPAGSVSGPATIRVRSFHAGQVGKVDWINTFYTPRGSYRVALRWDFRKTGTMTAKTIDPRSGGRAATGQFKVSHRRFIPFQAVARNGATAKGMIETRGGGSLFITVTLEGLPEGTVTYTFSGGRIRH